MPELRGRTFWGALCLFGALLVASRMRSAYVALFAFLAIGSIYGKRLRVRQLLLPLVALGLGAFLLDAFSSTLNYIVRDRESIATMSDRIPLWQYLTATVMRTAPFTGMGYYAASRVVATEYNEFLGNAHSVFFEVLIGGGLLGAALYVLLCLTLIWFAARLLRVAGGSPSAVAATGLLSIALLLGLTTPAALQAGPLGFAFWSLTAVLPGLLRESVRARLINAQLLDLRTPPAPAVANGRVAVLRQLRP
jgi:O-antigen ligase